MPRLSHSARMSPESPAPVPLPLRARPRGQMPLPGRAQQALFIADDMPVSLTNMDKVYFPDGTRKRDLLDYGYDLAPVLLPYLRDRPYTMKRFPGGIAKPAFFQKEAHAPDWVPTARLPSRGSSKPGREFINYILCNNTAALLYVINAGCIDHNVWMSRYQTPLEPDFVLLDLDPGPKAPFTSVVRVAQAIHKLLDEFEIVGYPKTSGATGMHVSIPIAPGHSFQQSQQFAALLLRMVASRLPALVTEVWSLAERPQDKVYLDFRQNAQGKTIPPPYSPRPLSGAPVSCPLRWNEVKAGLDPSRFTIRTMRKRLERLGDLYAPVLPGTKHESLHAMLRRIQQKRTVQSTW